MTSLHPSWRDAWTSALYGDEGFYRTSRPGEHFRTSAQGGLFAEAIAELARRGGSTTIVDMAAGSGELLTSLHDLGVPATLIGVELVDRPIDLPAAIQWTNELPASIDGLLVAHEWLDNIPCEVVELGVDGVVRIVEVDPATGPETLGAPYTSPWLDTWWPMTEPGQRAEVGESRDLAWADAVARVDGIAVAIDYAHTRETRPPFGSLRSYAGGREVDVIPDGTRDVTAHVAIDSVAAAVGATLTTQRDTLAELGLDGARPPLELATTDPAAYLLALTRATQAGELRARGGWGDFAWAMTNTRDVEG
ncbi:MAG: SAM-dependent methyltransferase [Aeromicrobium sp.]